MEVSFTQFTQREQCRVSHVHVTVRVFTHVSPVHITAGFIPAAKNKSGLYTVK